MLAARQKNGVGSGSLEWLLGAVNLGAERKFKIDADRSLAVRLDVVNVADKTYELRDGTGVGVNAAQFGMRRGFFGSVSYAF